MADTTIKTYLDQIIIDRNRLRSVAMNFRLDGITDESKLSPIASAFETIQVVTDPAVISQTVKDGETATLPAGYYPNGAEVIGTDESGSYILVNVIDKHTEAVDVITPCEHAEIYEPGEGNYGLKGFTVAAIPARYRNVEDISEELEASAEQVLVGRQFIDRTLRGEGVGPVTGTMANNADWSDTLTIAKPSVEIPKGFHNGEGAVDVATKEITVPFANVLSGIPVEAEDKFITKVTVEGLPENYRNVDDITLTDADAKWLIAGQSAVGKDADGKAVKVEGSMANLGDQSATLNVATQSKTIEEGYVSGATITADAEAITTTISAPTGTIKSAEGKFITEVTYDIATQDKEVGPLLPGAADEVVSADEGKILGSVTVKALSKEYTSVADASVADAAKVLTGTTVYAKDANGEAVKVEGSMANLGDVSKALTVTDDKAEIADGYTSGGTVTVETKEITVPFANVLSGTAIETTDKFITKVNVEALPTDYVSVADATADVNAWEILEGNTVYAKDENGAPVKVVGTMVNRSAETLQIDGITATTLELNAGYYAEGTVVSLTDDIANILASI